MSKALLLGLSLLAVGGVAQAKTLTVIDFENLPGAAAHGSDNKISALDAHYKGLNWSDSFYVLHGTNYAAGSGYDHGAWGEWVGYTAWANPVSISADAGEAFNFYGGYFAAAWDSSLDLTVKGFRNGAEVYNTVLSLTNNPADLPKLYQLNFRNIDKVSFASSGTHVVFDNLQVQITPVPEPETYALMAAGLLATAVVRRRRAQ